MTMVKHFSRRERHRRISRVNITKPITGTLIQIGRSKGKKKTKTVSNKATADAVEARIQAVIDEKKVSRNKAKKLLDLKH